MRPWFDGSRRSILLVAVAFAVAGGRLEGQAAPRPPASHAFFIGPSLMNDRLADTSIIGQRPSVLEADYVLFSGPALRGGIVSLTGRAHYYANDSFIGGGVQHYHVASYAGGSRIIRSVSGDSIHTPASPSAHAAVPILRATAGRSIHCSMLAHGCASRGECSRKPACRCGIPTRLGCGGSRS